MTKSSRDRERAERPKEVADDDPLYQAALAVEKNEQLASEMTEWEEAAVADGIANRETI
jgi:hypothetical protein